MNIQTLMWVDAPTKRTLPDAQILGQTVHIATTLHDVTWSFGDGHTQTSSTAGKPYDPTGDPCRTVSCPDYFGHTYAISQPVRVTATVNWTATFSVGNGPQVAIPGTVAGPTAESDLTVKQARGILIANPPPR